MNEELRKDWDKIRSCFCKGSELPEDWRACGVATDRAGLVKLAASQMKPRTNTKRLQEQINFVCFGE